MIKKSPTSIWDFPWIFPTFEIARDFHPIKKLLIVPSLLLLHTQRLGRGGGVVPDSVPDPIYSRRDPTHRCAPSYLALTVSEGRVMPRSKRSWFSSTTRLKTQICTYVCTVQCTYEVSRRGLKRACTVHQPS